MVKILTSFRLNVHAIAVDLARCYRSMKSDWTGSRLRATWYPVDPTDPKNSAFRIFVYERVSYGDALAACLLEVMMRMHIAPGCDTEAGAKLIEMERYVDDILKSGLDQDELWKAILDMKKALEANGFSTKQIFSSKMWHKSLTNLLIRKNMIWTNLKLFFIMAGTGIQILSP
jgi:hypothetical protein